MGLLTLMAQLGMDTAGFDSGLKHAETAAISVQARIAKAFATRSTVTNATQARDAGKEYQKFWSETLRQREEMETAASVRAASRSNRARMLLRQRAAARERRITEELSGGSMPAAWSGFKRDWFNASEQASAGWRKWGGEAGRQIARVGKMFLAAFAFHKVLASLREVSAELDKMMGGGKERFLAEQRRKQLEALPQNVRENIMVGDAEVEAIGGGIKNYLANAAGLLSFGGSVIAEQLRELRKTKDVMGFLLNWGKASQIVAGRQSEVFNQMRQPGAPPAVDNAAELDRERRLFDLRLKRMNLEEKMFAIRFRLRKVTDEVEREELINQLRDAEAEFAKSRAVKPGIRVGAENLEIFDPLRRIGAFGQGADTGFKLVTLQERIARATERTAENTGEGPL